MWGLLLNRSRDIVRQCLSFFPEDDLHRKATFARWTIALSQSLKFHFRPAHEQDLQSDLKNVLCDEELGLLMTADHKVNCPLPIVVIDRCSCPSSTSTSLYYIVLLLHNLLLTSPLQSLAMRAMHSPRCCKHAPLSADTGLEGEKLTGCQSFTMAAPS
jgi:hypothetical protein